MAPVGPHWIPRKCLEERIVNIRGVICTCHVNLMDVIDYDFLAQIFLEANFLLEEECLRFSDLHDGSMPTAMNRAQSLRSHLGALVDSSGDAFYVESKYRGLGRVCIVSRTDESRFVVQSSRSLDFRAELLEETTLIDVSDDVVFLLVYEFSEHELCLEIAPARVNHGDDEKKYALISPPQPVGRWAIDGSQKTASEVFDQEEAESWFADDSDESGTGTDRTGW